MLILFHFKLKYCKILFLICKYFYRHIWSEIVIKIFASDIKQEEAKARKHHYHHSSSTSSSSSSSVTFNSDFTNPTNLNSLRSLLQSLDKAESIATIVKDDLNIIINGLSTIKGLFLLSSSSENFDVMEIKYGNFLKDKFNASKCNIFCIISIIDKILWPISTNSRTIKKVSILFWTTWIKSTSS